MRMNPEFKLPPKSVKLLTSPKILLEKLSGLIGTEFKITGKPRTDGSGIRKLIAATLEKSGLIDSADADTYEITIPKSKGVPKIIREFIDTYIVTSGNAYNLQVWNRIPGSKTLLIKYESGESLKSSDVRFVFVKIDVPRNVIDSIIIMSPYYIEKNFGKFGTPTIKHQLLISRKARQLVYDTGVLCFPDSSRLSYIITNEYVQPKSDMMEEPSMRELYSIGLLRTMVAEKLIGRKLNSAGTKNRGQALERIVLELLGYKIQDDDLLYGGFPDIKNQLLEVKVQDSPTVDLGRFTPEKEELVVEEFNLTTFDVRYLIALTNPKTEIIEGVILAPGEKLGELFSYVSAQSYKCQRSIPMSFFKKYQGKAVSNPA